MSEQKNRSVIDTINNRNIRNRALSIVTYDFSTFFTNIPGIKPENVMRKPSISYFKGDEKLFILASRFGAARTDGENRLKITLDKVFLKIVINFSFDKGFIKCTDHLPIDH